MLTKAEIANWLHEEDGTRLSELWQMADAVRRERVGDAVHLRGLLEVSNHCARKPASSCKKPRSSAAASARISPSANPKRQKKRLSLQLKLPKRMTSSSPSRMGTILTSASADKP